MNPSISASHLEAERARDPDAFRREYEAEFGAGADAAFDAAQVRAAVRPDSEILPWRQEYPYVVALDPAFRSDAFALIVGHREGERTIVDLVRGWQGTPSKPVMLEPTLDEVARLARAYGGAPAVTDQAESESIRQGLARRGVIARKREWTNQGKIKAVAALRGCLYAGNLELPPHQALVNELISFTQRALPSARTRYAAGRGGHDDYVTALLALVVELARAEWTAEEQDYANQLWRCRSCSWAFGWESCRPCPKCYARAPRRWPRAAPPLGLPLPDDFEGCP
jgi:hypothetical protein